VIGAGHNGLVAANRLAEAGLDVTVLEQAAEPGGGVRSAEATEPGFIHDLCAGFFPQAVASPAFRRLELDRWGVEWIDPPVVMAHPFLDGSAIALHRDVAATAESLQRTAAAGAAWTSLIERLWPHRAAVLRAAFSRFPPVRPGLRLAVGLRRDGIELARQLLGSAASLGLELFDDDRAAAWLSGSVAHSDLTPGSAGSAGLAFGLAFLGHVVGWPFPRGGAGRVTDALVTRLREHGGTLRCDAPVEGIDVARGRVSGARLSNGERLPADALVATVGPRPLVAMLPPGALGERLTHRLRSWRYGLGTFKLDLALDGPVPWKSDEAREAAVVHVGDMLDDLFTSAQEAGRGRVPARPALVVGQHSLHDRTRAPAGKHTLYIYARVPQAPDLPDAEIATLIEQRIEEFAPGFGALVRARCARGPHRLEQENPALVGGDLASGSLELDQQLIFRPAPELCRYRSPVRGLYVAGGSTHPGPGVQGVSGDGAARALLAVGASSAPRTRRLPGFPAATR
jgi:phytoene dehydrogenase-like protein